MHLTVPGAIGHFYYLRQALTKAAEKVAYMSKKFHQEIKYRHHLVTKMETCPTYLAEVFQQQPTALGVIDASGMGAGGVWIDPNKDNQKYVWRIQWQEDIRKDLVSWNNLNNRITNSDLELVALVLQESIFPLVCLNPAWHVPITGSDNTTTVP